MTERTNPVDKLLDLFVYLPAGIAITTVEELPRITEKGRRRVDQQIQMARNVGQFAVQLGRQQIEKKVAPGIFGPQVATPVRHGASNGADASHVPTDDAAGERVEPRGPVPAHESLAIPGYDSLSASQVVQRLGGLDNDELVAVQSYEAGMRRRRTILGRLDQLLAPSGTSGSPA